MPEAERQAIADYTQRAEQAAEAGEKGLATNRETIGEDETSHFEGSDRRPCYVHTCYGT